MVCSFCWTISVGMVWEEWWFLFQYLLLLFCSLNLLKTLMVMYCKRKYFGKAFLVNKIRCDIMCLRHCWQSDKRRRLSLSRGWVCQLRWLNTKQAACNHDFGQELTLFNEERHLKETMFNYKVGSSRKLTSKYHAMLYHTVPE